MPCCVAVNCSNRSEKGFRLFRFPANVQRRSIWIQNMRRGDNWVPTRFSNLCEKHFEDSQFESHRMDGRRKLKPNSIPTLFDVPDPLTVIDPPPQEFEYKFIDANIVQENEEQYYECNSVETSLCKINMKMPEAESGSKICDNEQIASLRAENESLKLRIRRMHAILKRLSSQLPARKYIEKSEIDLNEKNDQYRFSSVRKELSKKSKKINEH